MVGSMSEERFNGRLELGQVPGSGSSIRSSGFGVPGFEFGKAAVCRTRELRIPNSELGTPKGASRLFPIIPAIAFAELETWNSEPGTPRRVARFPAIIPACVFWLLRPDSPCSSASRMSALHSTVVSARGGYFREDPVTQFHNLSLALRPARSILVRSLSTSYANFVLDLQVVFLRYARSRGRSDFEFGCHPHRKVRTQQQILAIRSPHRGRGYRLVLQ